MASTSGLRVADSGAVRSIAFDRPEARNALRLEEWNGLAQALRGAVADENIGVVTISGVGSVFTAGADLSAEEQARDLTARRAAYDAAMEALEGFDKPLLAGVNGAAVGFGTTLLAHCDIVIAHRDARFRLPFGRLGVPPEGGCTATLPQRIGWAATAELLFTSGWIDSEQARAIGLVQRLVDSDDVADELRSLAEEIAMTAPAVLQTTKQLLVANRGATPAQARRRESAAWRR
jgi:enoyl-CoA hydratase/carnithine racemase